MIQTLDDLTANDAPDDPARWEHEHVAPYVLAQACAEQGPPLLIFSSSRVFDLEARVAHDEAERPNPAGEYGRSQVKGENLVLSVLPGALVVRTDLRFGPWQDGDVVLRALQALASGGASGLPRSQVLTLTYLPDLVHACLDLLLDGEQGVWHLSNAGTLDDTAFRACAAQMRKNNPILSQGSVRQTLAPEVVSRLHSALVSRRGALLPPWQSALQHLAHTRSSSLTVPTT